MEKQIGNAVKAVRSDRGTEFLNAELQNFLVENGIRQQTSAPYTPQQNGYAERYNMTMLEKVRAVLSDCGLDKSFWNFAVEHCVFVRNRLRAEIAFPSLSMLPRKTAQSGSTYRIFRAGQVY